MLAVTALLAYRYNRTDPEIPPALEYSSVTVRGTCPMLGGCAMLACLLYAVYAVYAVSKRGL